MKKYKVQASYVTYLEGVVEAENESDAREKGEELAQNGGMREICPFDSDFSINSVEEVL